MNKCIAIIHFLPLEKYPPVMNLIRTLEKTESKPAVCVFSSSAEGPVSTPFTSIHDRIRIYRLNPAPGLLLNSRIKRICNLLAIAVRLLKIRPSTVLCYDTYSVFPVWLYAVLTGWKSRIHIHYHEYISPEEIQKSPFLIRIFSALERRMWSRVSWISHTHPLRMERFKADNSGLLPEAALQIIPNYPPRSWTEKVSSTEKGTGKKLVYVGVLGLDTMYLPEVSAWLDGPGEEYILDLYAFQVNADVRKFLKQFGSSRIRLQEGVNYYDLPGILRSYDIGLILYKGHVPNYTLIAPNKLFEYLSCGLEVWLPKQMVGSHPYVNRNVKPRVLAVDFENLSKETVGLQPAERALAPREEVYICEEAFQHLIVALTQEI